MKRTGPKYQIDRLRKRTGKRLLGWRRRAWKRLDPLRAFWLRFDDEAPACPACDAATLSVLDVLRVRGDLTGRRVSFLTGCEACGLVFTNPLPHPDRLARYYAEEGVWGEAHAERAARIAAAHEEARGRPQASGMPRKRLVLLDAMQPFLPVSAPRPGAKVLDFGCGEGKLLNTLQDWGWQTYGIEPSTTVAFLRHTGLDAPPQDGSFDLAILHHVLEHVPNPLEILRQLGASLREGGMLFISVPRFDALAQHGDFHYCINGRHHVVAFTERCLRSLLARAGLEVVARLDATELDEALTKGTPLRLRLLARRAASPPPLPASPLDAARTALAAYARAHLPVRRRLAAAVPLRLRGGWMEWKLAH